LIGQQRFTAKLAAGDALRRCFWCGRVVVEQVSNLLVIKEMFTGLFKTRRPCFCASGEGGDATAEE
jgi:hypothetical protein